VQGLPLVLDVFKIAQDPCQSYRLFTSLFILGSGTWKSAVLMEVGLHVGTWFVIASNKSRWQKIILILVYNYLVLCLIAYFFSEQFDEPDMMDIFSFAHPQLPLLVSVIATTFMLEDTVTYVPSVVRNILAVWYVFMQLSAAIPCFTGLVIGLCHGVLA